MTGRARVDSHGVDAVTSARFKERIVADAELERDGVVAFRGGDAQRTTPLCNINGPNTAARGLSRCPRFPHI